MWSLKLDHKLSFHFVGGVTLVVVSSLLLLKMMIPLRTITIRIVKMRYLLPFTGSAYRVTSGLPNMSYIASFEAPVVVTVMSDRLPSLLLS